jgi:hypothetical protein
MSGGYGFESHRRNVDIPQLAANIRKYEYARDAWLLHDQDCSGEDNCEHCKNIEIAIDEAWDGLPKFLTVPMMVIGHIWYAIAYPFNWIICKLFHKHE